MADIPYDDDTAPRDALLREIAAYANSHGLADASLFIQFGSYMRHTRTPRWTVKTTASATNVYPVKSRSRFTSVMRTNRTG